MFFLFFLFISCHFSKLVAFFSSHVSSKLVASTFLCLVDSVVVHKKLGTLMSTPFANVICRLLSHLHFLMSKLKRAQDHLQNVISRTLALFWESFALVTTMIKVFRVTVKKKTESPPRCFFNNFMLYPSRHVINISSMVGPPPHLRKVFMIIQFHECSDWYFQNLNRYPWFFKIHWKKFKNLRSYP